MSGLSLEPNPVSSANHIDKSLRNDEINDESKSNTSNESNEINESNELNELNESNESNELNESNESNEPNESNESNEINEINEVKSSFQSLFPSTTCIKDFGYPDSHPLRVGDFDINNLTDDDDDDSYHDNDFYDPTYFHNSNDDFNDNTDFYSNDEINRKAIALFDFPPENDNEVGLTEGQIIWISYRHGQGWLVAEDPNSGENGLVPEEYVEIIYDDEDVREDIPKPFLPQILQPYNPINDEDISHGNSKKNSKKKSMKHNPDDEDSEWVDTDFEDDPNDDTKDLTSGIKNTSIQ